MAISAGEVSPIMAGMHYCSMIEACQELSEFARARQWTSALSRWCDTQPNLLPFTGQCAVHRGQLIAGGGGLRRGDRGVRARADARYEQAGEVYAAGLAIYEPRRGAASPGAARAGGGSLHGGPARRSSHNRVWPYCGSSRERGDAAVAALTRCLAEARDVVHRAHLLPAVVEARLAAGDIEAARAAAGELTEAAAATGCASTRARSAAARAAVTLAVGEAVESLAQRPGRRCGCGTGSTLRSTPRRLGFWWPGRCAIWATTPPAQLEAAAAQRQGLPRPRGGA